MSERRVYLFCGVDIAVGQSASECFRGHVHQFHLVRRPHESVRYRVFSPYAGDVGGHIPQRLQLVDVDCGDDINASVEEIVDVLPSLPMYT